MMGDTPTSRCDLCPRSVGFWLQSSFSPLFYPSSCFFSFSSSFYYFSCLFPSSFFLYPFG